jgi:hypothetical protein
MKKQKGNPTKKLKLEMERLRNIMASPGTETIEARKEAQEKYMQLNTEILEVTKKNPNIIVEICEPKFKLGPLSKGLDDGLLRYFSGGLWV